jgi:hypothetical protein
VLSVRGLCDGMITSPEESYQVRRIRLSVNVETSTLTKLTPTWAVERGLEKWFVIRYANAVPGAVRYPEYVYSQGLSWLAVLTSSSNYL